MTLLDRVRSALGGDEGGAYNCRGCGTEFDVQYHVCPVCGSFGVDPVHEVLIEGLNDGP